jgi:hypothetical protein
MGLGFECCAAWCGMANGEGASMGTNGEGIASASEILLQAAALNYARWQSAWPAHFTTLACTNPEKLAEYRRAGVEVRAQLRDAAERYALEIFMCAP